MKYFGIAVLSLLLLGVGTMAMGRTANGEEEKVVKTYKVHPIGWVRKTAGRTTIVVYKKYQDGLLGLDKFSEVWVLYYA